MTRIGVGASYRHILTVPGRRTGRLHSTPVDVMQVGGARWLVAGYGPANWVRNARAAGEVTLSRGTRTEAFGIAEAAPEEAVQVLRTYMTEVRVTRRTSRPHRTRPTKRSGRNSPGTPSFGSFLTRARRRGELR